MNISGVPTKILVVDDSKSRRSIIGCLLRQAGYTVAEAASGEEGLSLAHDTPQPSLIILEVHLPDLEGFEVCRRLKADPATAVIPVIHLTDERGDEDARVEGLESGALACLVQPVSPRELLAQVRTVLRVGQTERELHEGRERLRLLSDNLPYSVVYQYVHEPDGSVRFIYISAGIERLNGVSVQDVLRDAGTLHRQILPEYLKRLMENEAHSARELTDFDMDVPMRRTDGQVRWMRVRSRPRRMPDGRVVWDGVQTDVTERRGAEEALRQSEQLYKTMGDAIPYGVWMCNAQGGAEYVSQSFLDLLEMTMAEMRQFGWTRRMPPDEVEPMMQRWLHCVATGLDWEGEHHVLGPDGEYHTVLTRGKPVRDEQGNITCWVGINLDITERKRIEQELGIAIERLAQSEAHLQHVLDSLFAFMGVMTPDGVLTYINQVTLEISGLRWDDVVGKPFHEVAWWSHDPAVLKQVRDGVERARGGERVRFDTTALMAEGRRIDIDLAIAPMRDEQGTITHLVPSAVEITERKQAEEALREANRQLAVADRHKDEFLAMLAHELRNPLAPVRNAVQILNLISAGDPTLQRQRAIIDRQVTHMARLLDDLLDISRVTRGKITLNHRELHVKDVLLHAIETARPLIESRHHTLQFTAPPEELRVEGDADRLAQVVGNLLTNAAKYTEDGGEIWLSAWPQEGMAVIEVRDNGMGIAVEMLPRVFDLFAQADRSLDRAQGGLGIGLSMVKRLTELHGGSVDACSDGPGQGAIFVVRLPALAKYAPEDEGAGAPAAETPAAGHSAGKRPRILVVDDLADAALSLAELLEIWGYQAHTAFDGPAALEAARAFRPELVLLDIGMPGMNGYETARRLRQEHDRSLMVLVAMTGYGQEEDRRQAEEAGFDHHLVKPVDLAQLRNLVTELILNER